MGTILFEGCFFFNDTATTEIYTLSLHDALPILIVPGTYTVRTSRTMNGSVSAAAMVVANNAVLTANSAALARTSTRLNSRHLRITDAAFCLTTNVLVNAGAQWELTQSTTVQVGG